LEIGKSLFIKVNVQFEGEESVRLTAHSMEPLDDVAAQTAAGLQVFMEDPGPVSALRERLGREARGRGKVVVIAKLDPVTEVPIALPGSYAISTAMIQDLRRTPGITDVREM